MEMWELHAMYYKTAQIIKFIIKYKPLGCDSHDMCYCYILNSKTKQGCQHFKVISCKFQKMLEYFCL